METKAQEFVKKSREMLEEEKLQEKMRERRSHKNNIKDGFIIIDHVEIEIREKEFLKGKITIEVPKDMLEMTEEMKDIKYPSLDRPKYIYTNEDNSLDMSIEYDETDYMTNEETIEVTEMIKKEITRLYPSSDIEEDGILEVDGKNVGYFSFTVPVIDGDLYTFMVFQELQGKMLFCTFNCSEKIKEEWNEVILQMVESITEKDKKDNEDGE